MSSDTPRLLSIHTTDPKHTSPDLLSARPVSAISQGGTYTLLETGSSLPLVVGDVVRARRDRTGCYVLTGIEEYRSAAHFLAHFPPFSDPELVAEQTRYIEQEGFSVRIVRPGLIVGHHDLRDLPDPYIFPVQWHVHLSSPRARETACRSYLSVPPLQARSA